MLMEIHMTYPIKRFSTLCRIGGFGYRTIYSLPHRQSPRIRRLLAMFTKRSMPLDRSLVRPWYTIGPLSPQEDRWGDSGEIQCRSNFLFTRGIRAVRGGTTTAPLFSRIHTSLISIWTAISRAQV